MPRPLKQCGIVQLEEMFSASNGDAAMLKQLDDELQYRHVPRAVALHAKVQRAMSKAKTQSAPNSEAVPPVPGGAVPQARQPDLWGAQTSPVSPIVPPTAEERPTSRPVAPPTAIRVTVPSTTTVREAEIQTDMSVNNAYRILKATPASTWEEIEETRRQLVQQAHPQRLAQLSPERRAQVQAEARRANAAYAVLLGHLIGNG